MAVVTGVTGPPYTLTGLDAGSSYRARVRAVNGAGASGWSSWVGFTTLTGEDPPPQTRPYLNAADWLWDPIPASPALDPNSAAMVSSLAQAGAQRVLNTYAFGVTIRGPEGITAQTPRYSINFTAGWGNPFGTVQMPIPNGTPVPGFGTDPNYDGHVSVVDPVTGYVFNLWRANFSGATKYASYGAMVALDGDGRETNGSSTGAGLARLGGVIRLADMAAGHIPHALFFSTDRAAPSTNFRYPATKSDGSGQGLIPEGARIQLDPSLNIDAMSMTAGEKIIAKALQTFGAYCGDNGGARMAFIAEYEGSNPGPTYAAKGLTSDYFNLTGIPWGSLRVLKSWNGA